MALITFCGSALKEVAVRRLPQMLVEADETYGCYTLILESIVVPPGLLTTEQIKKYFKIGGQGVGLAKHAQAWPKEEEEVLRRIMSEGLRLQPGVEYRQVR